jgi:hypothetical protein
MVTWTGYGSPSGRTCFSRHLSGRAGGFKSAWSAWIDPGESGVLASAHRNNVRAKAHKRGSTCGIGAAKHLLCWNWCRASGAFDLQMKRKCPQHKALCKFARSIEPMRALFISHSKALAAPSSTLMRRVLFVTFSEQIAFSC